MESKIVEHARALAARGFKVFPIKAGAKAPPLWKDWPNRSSTTIPADWPENANIGIHCDGFIVIDVDVQKGGNESLRLLEVTHGIPDTLVTLTPSGGQHLFFRSDKAVLNTVAELGPGLDIRSRNGYVVASGSVVPAGHYRFQEENALIADAPEWLVLKLRANVLKSGSNVIRVVDADSATIERAAAWLATWKPATEGEGGDAHTFATAAFLRDFGLSEKQTLDMLLDSWNARCSPPWSPTDLGVKVHNAYQYATGTPGAKAVTAADFPKPDRPHQNGALRLADFADSATSGPGYLVKGLLQQRSYAELYGPPGVGKTFVALDLAYHVAAGEPWMSRRVKQGATLYLAYEGTGGLIKRAQALRQHYGNKDVPMYVSSGAAYNLRDRSGRQALGCALDALPERPALIVIDTFSRALAGGDENSAQDVSAFNGGVVALIEHTGACVLVIHHTGKDKSRGPRGSSALQGAIDTEIEIDIGVLTPTKQRDMELSDTIGFRLVPLVVGIDEDGDPATSCIVQAHSVQVSAAQHLAGNAQAGWDILCLKWPGNEPVTLNAWREACREFLGDANLLKRFFDIKSKLEHMHLIEVSEEGRVTRKLE